MRGEGDFGVARQLPQCMEGPEKVERKSSHKRLLMRGLERETYRREDLFEFSARLSSPRSEVTPPWNPGSIARNWFAFATFEVNLCSGQVRKGGVKLKLSGQPFQVLAILLERPGEVVTREELPRGYRLIHIGSLAANVLKVHLAGKISGIVFPSKAGTYLNDANLRQRWFNPLIEKLGIPQPKGSSFHAIRHGRISLLREAGIANDIVMKWAGHSTLKVTDHYTHRGAHARQNWPRESRDCPKLSPNAHLQTT
jgi:hypothetical protein